MKKAYVKPEIFYQPVELSYAVATCSITQTSTGTYIDNTGDYSALVESLNAASSDLENYNNYGNTDPDGKLISMSLGASDLVHS